MDTFGTLQKKHWLNIVTFLKQVYYKLLRVCVSSLPFDLTSYYVRKFLIEFTF